MMDWGDATEFVTFGAVGEEEVDDSTDVYILIAPQNIVGNTILTGLGEHVRSPADTDPNISRKPAVVCVQDVASSCPMLNEDLFRD